MILVLTKLSGSVIIAPCPVGHAVITQYPEAMGKDDVVNWLCVVLSV